MNNKELDFENLEVSRGCINFYNKIFDVVDKFSAQLQFLLGEQLRSSSLSISNNIAEGSEQNTSKEKSCFTIMY